MSATCTMKCAVIRPSVTNVADHLSHAYFDCLMTILVLSLLPLSFSFCYSTILPSLSSFSQRALLIWLSFLDLLRRTWMTCWYRSSLTSLHPWRGSCKPFVFGLETKLSWEWGWFGVGMRLGWKWESRTAIPVWSLNPSEPAEMTLELCKGEVDGKECDLYPAWNRWRETTSMAPASRPCRRWPMK